MLQETSSPEEDGLSLDSGILLKKRNLFYQKLLWAHYIKSVFGTCQRLLTTCGMRRIIAHGLLLEVYAHGAAFSQESKGTWRRDL